MNETKDAQKQNTLETDERKKSIQLPSTRFVIGNDTCKSNSNQYPSYYIGKISQNDKIGSGCIRIEDKPFVNKPIALAEWDREEARQHNDNTANIYIF